MQPYPWDALLGEMLPILLLTGIALLVGIPLTRQFRKQASFMDDQSRIANEVAERSETQIREAEESYRRSEQRGDTVLKIQQDILSEFKQICEILEKKS